MKRMSIEELEQKRHDRYADYLKAIGTPDEWNILQELDAMDEELDAMEGREESDTGCAWDSWDEYLLDLKIDMAREDALDYER